MAPDISVTFFVLRISRGSYYYYYYIISYYFVYVVVYNMLELSCSANSPTISPLLRMVRLTWQLKSWRINRMRL